MNAPSTIFVKWQSDIDPATMPEDDIAFVFTHPTKGASQYQLSLPQAESSDEMTQYRVTADPLHTPVIVEATTEDEAWNKAIDITKMHLYNDKVEELPTRESMASQIETQQARIVELEAIVKWYIKWAEKNTPENKLLTEARATMVSK